MYACVCMCLFARKRSTNFLPHYWKYRYGCHQPTGVAPIHRNLFFVDFLLCHFFSIFYNKCIPLFIFIWIGICFYCFCCCILKLFCSFTGTPGIHISSAQLYAHSYLYARKWWLRHQWQLAFHSKSYHTAFQFRSPFVGYCYVCHTFCCTLIYVYTCGCCCPTGYRLYRQIRVYTKVYTIYYILHTCRHTYVCVCVYDVCLLRFDHLGALLTNRWVDLLVFRSV